VIELFWLGVTAIRRCERKLMENRRFRRNGASLAKNFRYKMVVPTNHFFRSENYMNGPFIR